VPSTLTPSTPPVVEGVILEDGTPDGLFKLDRPGPGEATRTQFATVTPSGTVSARWDSPDNESSGNSRHRTC